MPLIYCQLPYSNDSAELANRFSALEDFAYLDSGQPEAEQGRFDVISACATDAVLVDNQLQLHHPKAQQLTLNSPAACDFFESWFEADLKLPGQLNSLCFTTGWLGQLDYELGSRLHKLAPTHKEAKRTTSRNAYLGQLNYYRWSIVVDHQQQRSFLICQHPNQSGEQSLAHVLAQLPEQAQQAFNASANTAATTTTSNSKRFELQQSFAYDTNESSYHKSFAKIQDYIHAGDCYQVNLTQRFSSRYQGDSWQAYLALRNVAPAPYSGFMRLAHKELASCSPELFLHSREQKVVSKPIKGTIARLAEPAADLAQQDKLRNSDKDNAENIMIVDLLRNDLSQLCLPFTVKTPKCCELESFSNVHHLVSQIEGQLSNDTSPLALLLASFPGGSITGAPKKRAMQIIQELEVNQRQAYCGTLFSYDQKRQLNANILIRSLEFNHGEVHCWGGGGITSGSDATDEYQESLTKIQKLLSQLEQSFLSS